MYEEQLFATVPSRRFLNQGPSLGSRSRGEVGRPLPSTWEPYRPFPSCWQSGGSSAPQSSPVSRRTITYRVLLSLALWAPWLGEAPPPAALSLAPSGRAVGSAYGDRGEHGPGRPRRPGVRPQSSAACSEARPGSPAAQQDGPGVTEG